MRGRSVIAAPVRPPHERRPGGHSPRRTVCRAHRGVGRGTHVDRPARARRRRIVDVIATRSRC